MTGKSHAPIRKLAATDRVDAFDCGRPDLDPYLRRVALASQQANSAQTYVAARDGVVIGCYSLAVGSVEPAAAAPRVAKGLPRHPVPVMLLARLAVDSTYQRRGLGRALLRDALIRTARAADIAGIRALLVHAKDEAARAWYRQWEFEPSVTDPLHLFLLVRDLKASVPRQET